MVIHKCDKCGKAMAVWIDVSTSVNASNPETNVGHLLYLHGKTEEYCQDCYDTIFTAKRCNKCKYYHGVHNVSGVAPCDFWNIGGVLWKDYCSRFEEGDLE